MQTRKNTEPKIKVLSRTEAEDLLDEGAPESVCSVLSITDPDKYEARFVSVVEEQEHVDLGVFSFEDVDESEDGAPTLQDMRVMVKFLRSTLKDLPEGCSLVIHCEAGISRSTAAAAIAWAVACPNLTDRQIAQRVVEDRPGAWPNEGMLDKAGELLDRPEFELNVMAAVFSYCD